MRKKNLNYRYIFNKLNLMQIESLIIITNINISEKNKFSIYINNLLFMNRKIKGKGKRDDLV